MTPTKNIIAQSPALIACKGTPDEEIFGYELLKEDGLIKLNLTTAGHKGRTCRDFIEAFDEAEEGKARERFDLYVSVSTPLHRVEEGEAA